MTIETPPPAPDTGASTPPAPNTPPSAPPPGGNTPPPQTPPAPSPDPKAGNEPPKTPDPSSFKVPDAYKDKPWASKITNEDDLYKQIDNLNTLVGKKIVVPDLAKATDAEREEYYKQTRPADVNAYEFAEGTDPSIKTVLGETMLKNGVSAPQANAVIKAYQEAEKVSTAEFFSEAGMKAEMEKSFGAEWQKVTGSTINIIKGSSITADDKAMMDKLPNQFLGLMTRMASALIKDYGIVEKPGAHTNAGTGVQTPTDVGAVRRDLRSQIEGLSSKPHTQAEKDALVQKLNDTYKS